MKGESDPIAPRPETPEPKVARHPAGVALSGVIGLAVLLGLVWAGGAVRTAGHLTLPGPVIGLAALAAIWLLAERFHGWTHRQGKRHVAPVSRLLVSHLGLLFVPAGVGIITEAETLRQGWLPILAALVGSTFIGLVATGWCLHRFAPKKPAAAELSGKEPA